MQRFLEILRLLFGLSRILIASMIVIRQVCQVGLQVTEHVRTLARLEILPVFGLQAVIRCELLFGLKNQAGEPAGGMNFDNPHVEVRRYLVKRVAVHKGIVGSSRVGVAALIEVEFAKVAVYIVFVDAFPVL